MHPTAAFGAAVLLASVAQATLGWTQCSHLFASLNPLPYEHNGSIRVCRESYLAISYDAKMVAPAFSAYYVTPDDVNETIPGRDNFYEDPDLIAAKVKQAAVSSEAFNTSWNRGHLAPSHVMSYSTGSKKATYTMANVAPQAGYFNQHPWNMLESHLYDWIKTHKPLYIITAVAFADRTRPQKSFGIGVPDYYLKVACDVTTKEAVGFIAKNVPEDKEVPTFVPVTAVEKIYGGQLLPRVFCNVDTVNQNYWW